MDTNALPTKRNLLIAKQNLKLAKKGYELLELKHSALVHEINQTEKLAEEIRKRVCELLRTAERSLVIAKIECGFGACDDTIIWDSLDFEEGVIKGATIPASLDEAYFAHKRLLAEQELLNQTEEKLTQLKTRAKRTKKRAAALDNIAIPTYKTRIKYILGQIEETERDEAVRLKVARQFHGDL